MRVNLPTKLFILGTTTLLLVSVLSAFATGLNVSRSNVGSQSVPVTADDIKPAVCDDLHLTNIVSGSGVITGTAANDLLIGSVGIDTIDGLGGDDCIVAGKADDIVIGGGGNDACLGGPGTDTLDATCEIANQ